MEQAQTFFTNLRPEYSYTHGHIAWFVDIPAWGEHGRRVYMGRTHKEAVEESAKLTPVVRLCHTYPIGLDLWLCLACAADVVMRDTRMELRHSVGVCGNCQPTA